MDGWLRRKEGWTEGGSGRVREDIWIMDGCLKRHEEEKRCRCIIPWIMNPRIYLTWLTIDGFLGGGWGGWAGHHVVMNRKDIQFTKQMNAEVIKQTWNNWVCFQPFVCADPPGGSAVFIFFAQAGRVRDKGGGRWWIRQISKFASCSLLSVRSLFCLIY